MDGMLSKVSAVLFQPFRNSCAARLQVIRGNSIETIEELKENM
jgi:hypothetical protein